MHKTFFDSKRSPSDIDPISTSLPGVLVAQLGAGHRRRIAAHLLALSATDRRLRFGHSISDTSISDYVRRIRFVRDAAFGAFDDSAD
jgi:hypothetical protein